MSLNGYYQHKLIVTHDVDDIGREFDEFLDFLYGSKE